MAMTVFELLGRIAVDNTSANKGIDDTADRAGKAKEKIGDAFEKIGHAAVAAGKAIATGLAAGATAVGALVKSAVDSYSEYEQLVGGVKTLFNETELSLEDYAKSVGKSTNEALLEWADMTSGARKVMNNADEAFKTAGLSANEYMETVTSFSAALLQGLGGDADKAADIANTAIVDMSDNANKMGTDMAMIQNAYQGFAKQNYTLLDNLKLGYGGTQSEMAQLINDSGVLGDTIKVTAETVNEVSFDKIIEAIHVVQEDMGIAGATAAEAATTIEGSTKMMKAAWKNLVVGMADETADLELLVDQFVETVGVAAENILPRVEIALEGAGKLIDRLFPIIIEKIPGIINDFLPKILQSGVSILQNLIDGISNHQGTLSDTAFNALMIFIDAITEMLPQILELGVELLLTVAEGIVENLDELAASANEMVSKIVAILTEPNTLSRLLDAAVVILIAVANGIVDNLNQLTEAAVSVVVQLVEKITEDDTLEKLLDAAVQIILAISEGLIENLSLLTSATIELVSKIAEYIIEPDNLAKILDAAVDIIVALGNGLVENVLLLNEKATVLADNLASSLLKQDWGAVGGEIARLVFEGMGKLVDLQFGTNVVLSDDYDMSGPNLLDVFRGDATLGEYFGGGKDTGPIEPRRLAYEALMADGSHASGLDYVPYDGYVAELHKGEMVVPAEASKFLRSSGVSVSNVDIVQLLEQILYALQDGGFSLNINNREFARMVKAVT